MSFQTKQVQLPPIQSLFDALDVDVQNKTTPPTKNGTVDTSYMNTATAPSSEAPRVLARPNQVALSPLYNMGYSSAPATSGATANATASSPLNYSEYSNYYNYIRQPAGSVSASTGSISGASGAGNTFPYQGHYQPQRYTANIITSHNDVPRGSPNSSASAPEQLVPMGMHAGAPQMPMGMPLGMMHPSMHNGMGVGMHMHQQQHLHDVSKGKKSHRMTGKRSNLPKETVKILNDWLVQHLNNPYPTPAEKNELLRQTGLTKIQLSNWFINVRRRKVFTDHFDKKLVQAKSDSPVSGMPSAVQEI